MDITEYDSPCIPRKSRKEDDPKMIGSWKIGRVIGKGSSGRVRIARHARTGQYAAVKIVSKNAILESRMSLDDLENEADRILMAIEREIVIMKLIDHPSILRLYDVWETSNELYLILEYVEGGELFEYLCDKGKLSTSEALDYFQQVISAVDYCHRFNIAHRDLKPENLLLDKNKKIKVADFGMAAWQKNGASSLLQTACGSPHYAAPEVIMGKSYNGFSSDIWSCGVVLYALLAGRLPFDDEDLGTLLAKVKIGKFTMPNSFDPLAKDLISRMLEKDTAKRITMAEILQHPFYNMEKPKTASHQIRSLENMSQPISAAEDVDPDILANLRTLWHDVPEEDIIGHLTSDDPTWEKGVYHLLVQYRTKHLEDYDPDEEEVAAPKARPREKASSSSQKQTTMPRTTSRPKHLGQTKPCPVASNANHSTSVRGPEIVLHSASPSASDPSLPDNTPPEPPQKQLPPTPPHVQSNSAAGPPAAQDDQTQDFFRQIVDHLTAMELASHERSTVQSSSTGSDTSGLEPTIRCVPAHPPNAPPPTPAGSRFADEDLPAGQGPNRGAATLGGDLNEAWCSFENVQEHCGPRNTRRRPPPLDLAAARRDEDEENFVLITPEDLDFPQTKAPVLRSLLTPVSTGSSERSPLSDRHIQIIEPERPSKLRKKRSRGISPVSPAFSDDSWFPPSPSSSSPKRRWFGQLFKFKPARYQLLSMADVYNTREECRRLLMGMGVQVTHCRSTDGLDVLKCRLEEVRDPAGVMDTTKAVQFRVEVQRPTHAQTIAGFTILLNLIQEKGALSSFRLMYNRLRREWDLDAPRPSLSLSLPSSAFNAGVSYAEAVYHL
ncbi:Pkinase-domain-containing protein [Heliocybe sulcata]|uniref:non-specific serine/threonine protein kinase n=1 Tax=Heliocybe sulcata TaxID=5364 RepID=A0A5C3N6S2_9AGAM|nr:Pkinase-domain-containing protein [Heliocybe sulcata]